MPDRPTNTVENRAELALNLDDGLESLLRQISKRPGDRGRKQDPSGSELQGEPRTVQRYVASGRSCARRRRGEGVEHDASEDPRAAPAQAPRRQSPFRNPSGDARPSARISDRKLPLQLLSNLLWAVRDQSPKGPFGSPGITAASGEQLAGDRSLRRPGRAAVYLFDAGHHRLPPRRDGRILRAMAIGRGQTNVAIESARAAHLRGRRASAFAHVGLPGAGVARSRGPEVLLLRRHGAHRGQRGICSLRPQGLAAWFHNCDRAGLSRKLKLRAEQRVLFSQTVGYPESKGRG